MGHWREAITLKAFQISNTISIFVTITGAPLQAVRWVDSFVSKLPCIVGFILYAIVPVFCAFPITTRHSIFASSLITYKPFLALGIGVTVPTANIQGKFAVARVFSYFLQFWQPQTFWIVTVVKCLFAESITARRGGVTISLKTLQSTCAFLVCITVPLAKSQGKFVVAWVFSNPFERRKWSRSWRSFFLRCYWFLCWFLLLFSFAWT
jgi:hypothetical protein